jgi:hypothetical protein
MASSRKTRCGLALPLIQWQIANVKQLHGKKRQ